MEDRTKNALIEDTMLGFEDHGIMTCFLHFDYGDAGHQGFGGYGLDEPKKDSEGKHIGRFGSAYGMEFIKQILETVGVEKWEQLKGKYVRVRFSEKPSGWSDKIEAIGHITKDKWFSPKELGEKYFSEEKVA